MLPIRNFFTSGVSFSCTFSTMIFFTAAFTSLSSICVLYLPRASSYLLFCCPSRCRRCVSSVPFFVAIFISVFDYLYVLSYLCLSSFRCSATERPSGLHPSGWPDRAVPTARPPSRRRGCPFHPP